MIDRLIDDYDYGDDDDSDDDGNDDNRCIYLDSNKWNRVLNIGGPDDGMTMKQQVSDVWPV